MRGILAKQGIASSNDGDCPAGFSTNKAEVLKSSLNKGPADVKFRAAKKPVSTITVDGSHCPGQSCASQMTGTLVVRGGASPAKVDPRADTVSQ